MSLRFEASEKTLLKGKFFRLDFVLSSHPASNEQASKAAKNQNGAHAFPILLSLSGVVSRTLFNIRDSVVGYRQVWSRT